MIDVAPGTDCVCCYSYGECWTWVGGRDQHPHEYLFKGLSQDGVIWKATGLQRY